MEAALLAADAMDEALTNCIGAGLPEDVHASARLALTAFRKACK
ncbi:hypothetical protein Ga0080574_TMP2767 [Salipiger abyssi]|uniref:Uncharacterized protein n=2 Tax=Salipiger abyssi TaxID=1250539 RepID=A0A1P8UUN6_9RHOB|nr:hypothetical protein Ga0080574_TMP2767 [Salipiger abyssi]